MYDTIRSDFSSRREEREWSILAMIELRVFRAREAGSFSTGAHLEDAASPVERAFYFEFLYRYLRTFRTQLWRGRMKPFLITG